MKVVILCGGKGTRLREETEYRPKPMVPIGGRPILWHIMKYYAHFGHREFVVCLGHQAEVIKQYFLTYNEALTNDFTLSDGGATIELASSDLTNWRITFVNTGLQSNVGERLRRVRAHVAGDDYFLAHYADTLTDAPIPAMIASVKEAGKVATFLSIRPTNYSFHTVASTDEGRVSSIKDITTADIWVNGGFFVLRSDIFEYMNPGEELVHEPFQRLIENDLLMTYRHDGFWAPMDTLKDRQTLEDLASSGNAPWTVWEREPGTGS